MAGGRGAAIVAFWPGTGYHLATMRYDIVFVPSAAADLRRLPAHIRPLVRQAVEDHLRHGPTVTSRSRIKRLDGVRQPQYRLRVGSARIFYDVDVSTVVILAIVRKADAADWLAQSGVSE